MKHWLWLTLAGLFLVAPWGFTSPTEPRKPGPREIGSYAAQCFLVPCNGGGERTCVIASGQGSSPLALYVYDAHGNCVAHDEPVAVRAGDDVAAEWFPTADGVFTVELRNPGMQPNAAIVAFR